jgi:hypothetical protein
MPDLCTKSLVRIETSVSPLLQWNNCHESQEPLHLQIRFSRIPFGSTRDRKIEVMRSYSNPVECAGDWSTLFMIAYFVPLLHAPRRSEYKLYHHPSHNRCLIPVHLMASLRVFRAEPRPVASIWKFLSWVFYKASAIPIINPITAARLLTPINFDLPHNPL